MKLEKATTGDIVLSCVIPGWGFLVGLIALIKREYRRALTMISISGALIAVFVVWRLWESDEPTTRPATATSPSIESQLLSAANEVTRSAPQMLDADTRLDGAVAGPGLTFTVLYTLPKVAASQVDAGAFDTRVAPGVRKVGCQSSELKPFFDSNVQVKYEYRGNDGARIGIVVLDRRSCGAS